MSTPDLSAVFSRIPLLQRQPIKSFKVTNLPGYTNHNFRLQSQEHDWVLRIPKTETDSYIDRAAEAHNQVLATQLDLAPSTTWRDDSGLSLTPTLQGRSLCSDDLNDDRVMARLAYHLARLHRSGFQFRGHANLAELLERYFNLVPIELQRDLSFRMDRAREQLEWLDDHDKSPVASHNDPVLENWILDGDRIWMIDWEFSAMASPYWDLAILCNAAGISTDRANKLLKAYCADEVQMEESVLSAYRFLLQLLSDCWLIAFVPETE